MRIIAGKYKRKTLCTLPGTDVTRPTSDRVKENLFNILQNEISEKNILDLFSGSGALGLECLSRGANFVHFVEENKEAIQCIKKNLLNIGVAKETFEISNDKVTDFLTSQNSRLLRKFHIIIADPPYKSGWYANALLEIEQSGICQSDCIVVLEMSLDTQIQHQKNWVCLQSKKYGKTKLEIWRLQIVSEVISG